MKSTKTISVIVPSRNNKDTIRDLLISITDQCLKPDEIIIVDSSSDHTPDIVREYPVKLVQTPAKGANNARNVGVKSSNGDILVFIDADCIAYRDWLDHLIRGFEKDNIACVGGSIKTSNLKSLFGLYGELSFLKLMPDYDNDLIITKETFSHSRKPVSANIAITREVFERIGDFDEKYRGGYEEFDYEHRIMEAGHNIFCSSKAIISHKHRETFMSLLKQYFQYGLGSGRFCRKYPESSFTRFHNRNEMILFGGLSLGVILMKVNIILVLLLVMILVSGLFLYYLTKSFRVKNHLVLLYPIVDILRAYGFYTGQLFGRLKRL